MARQSFDLPLVRSEEQQAILELGLQALRRINSGKSWDDWMMVGDALKVITEFAVERADDGPWRSGGTKAAHVFNQLWEAYQRSEGNNEKPLMRRLDLAGDEMPSSLGAFVERHVWARATAYLATGMTRCVTK
jgi:hypothetical protein